MLITKIYLATMSRADLRPQELEDIAPCYLYVDEFQNFANQAFSEILSESRKYKLALTVSNQYFDQIEEDVRKAIIGNVGTLILFRVGSTDALLMEKEMSPTFTAEHLVNLQFTQIYLRLMIDGVTSKPFSATTLLPIKAPSENYLTDIVFVSRQKYTAPKKEVENAIKEWSLKNFHNAKQEEESKKMNEEKKDEFNFADNFDDVENEDWNDEVITKEEKAVLQDAEINIPEIEEEIKIPEVSKSISMFVNSRKNAKLNAIVSHIKAPVADSLPSIKKEVPEDVLRNLLD
jgi:hypothetical protein